MLSERVKIRAEYHTLGCKLNFAETSTIGKLLESRGVEKAQDGELADIVIVNTCSVTAEADKKCRQLIRSIHRRNPDAAIVVTGCYAQLCHDEIAALPGVAIVAGNDRKGLLPAYIDDFIDQHDFSPSCFITPTKDIRDFTAACSRGDRTRYFLKVQDGCDYWCSYCTIPAARGRSRSGSIDQIVEQARNVAEEGGREIVITGVNIGDYGKGTDHRFIDLIRELDKVDGIERYRISSIEPNLLTEEIIEFVASSRSFMPHFHIPLQAGSDEVLKLMRRHYDTSLFASRIKAVKEMIPDAFIGVDLIAGMRGETRELFEKSRDFVASLDISRLHVFPYSERPGTRALNIEYMVSREEKHRRVAEMIEISDRKLAEMSRKYVGKTRNVLFEHTNANGIMAGFTDNYLRVNIDTPINELAGKVVPVKLTAFNSDSGEMEGTVE